MQKQLARLLLIVFLMQSTQLGEFAKLPLLVRHYLQHKQLHSETTVMGFIKMHYLDKTVVDADYAQDMQLPFKTANAHFLTIQLSLPPTFLMLRNSTFNIVKVKIPFPQFNLPLTFLSSVFQPPKIA